MRRRLALAAAGGALAILGYALGTTRSPGPEDSPPSAVPRSYAAGLDTGYPRSAAGARLAAAAYQRAFADPAILDPETLARRIEQIATPAFAETMLAANAPGADRLGAGPIGQGLAAGTETAYFAVPLGHRLLSYTPERARVLIWGFTVLGNSTTVEPTAYFGTSRTELLWLDDTWKIASTSSSFGPTPALTTPQRGGEGFAVIDLLDGMRPYGIAP